MVSGQVGGVVAEVEGAKTLAGDGECDGKLRVVGEGGLEGALAVTNQREVVCDCHAGVAGWLRR